MIAVVYKNTADITSVDETSIVTKQSLAIYPNPTKSSVTVRCPPVASGIYTLKIFNHQGILIMEEVHLFTDDNSIQVSLLPTMIGQFFCCLEDEKGNIVGTGQVVVTQ